MGYLYATKLGQPQLAVPLLQRTIALAPIYSSYAYVLLGEIARQNGNFGAAQRFFQEGVALFPRDGALVYYEGQLAQRQGSLSQALAYYKRATVLQPDVALYHAAYGESLLAAGDRQSAEQELQLVVRLNPFDWTDSRILAKLLIEDGNVSGAKEIYCQAIAKGAGGTEPTQAIATLGLGEC